MVPVLGIYLDFILETEDVIYVQLGKITEIGYFICGYNVMFFDDEIWIEFYSTLRVNILSANTLLL